MKRHLVEGVPVSDLCDEYQLQPTPADFVIRAKEERCTPERDSGPEVDRKVRQEVSAAKIHVRQTIALSQTPKRKARSADLEIRPSRP